MKFLCGCLTLAMAALTQPALAKSFGNLSFEQAVVAPDAPLPGLLDWDVAAPNWQHVNGADTDRVYYGLPHVGLTPWYLLVDARSSFASPLEGRYSMMFVSGYTTNDLLAPWVHSFLAQSGPVPATARSMQLLAAGPLVVTVNGLPTPLMPLGNSRFAIDVSDQAGTFAEIRFINASFDLAQHVTLDMIGFSASPVPEPGRATLTALASALGLLWCARRGPASRRAGTAGRRDRA